MQTSLALEVEKIKLCKINHLTGHFVVMVVCSVSVREVVDLNLNTYLVFVASLPMSKRWNAGSSWVHVKCPMGILKKVCLKLDLVCCSAIKQNMFIWNHIVLNIIMQVILSIVDLDNLRLCVTEFNMFNMF